MMLLRSRLLTGVVILLCAFAPPPQPAAAEVVIKQIWWPHNAWTSNLPSDASCCLGPNSFTVSLAGPDFRWISDQSQWGIHLKYETGAPGSIVGSDFFALTPGTITIWSADVLHQWQFSGFSLRGFAGYGKIDWASSKQPVLGRANETISGGLRVGADFSVPLPNISNFSFNGALAWYPSNATYFNSGLSSNAPATDLSASIQYTSPQGWLIEGGWRQLTWDTGSVFALPFGHNEGFTMTQAGPFFGLGYRFK